MLLVLLSWLYGGRAVSKVLTELKYRWRHMHQTSHEIDAIREIERLEREVEQLTADLDQIAQQNVELTTENGRLLAENSELKRSLSDSQYKLRAVRQDRQKIKSDLIEELAKTRCTRCESVAAENSRLRNIMSNAESTFVLGGTAEEIANILHNEITGEPVSTQQLPAPHSKSQERRFAHQIPEWGFRARVLAWLGQWRDEMPGDAVGALQDIVSPDFKDDS